MIPALTFRSSQPDITRSVCKGHRCIKGNVPVSLLRVGTRDDVIAYCKKFIDVAGKDGGYILSPRSSVEEVKPENLKEYGVHN
jgi:hypothetical protein